MPIFNPSDIVRVPFPYVDLPQRQFRPALVVSASNLGANEDLFWAVMITSAANKGWAGDVSVEADHIAFGLPVPSVIRTEKIAVIEAGMASLLGRVSAVIMIDVKARLTGYLEIAAAG